MTHLKNQHIVIIGGSSGFGLAAAKQAHAQGARLTLVARDSARLTEAAAGFGATAIVGDMNSPNLDWAKSIAGPIDHVFFSAGSFAGGPFLGGDLDQFRPAIEGRLWGAAKLVQALHGLVNTNGSFTFTGGISTRKPNPGAWITNIATAVADQMAKSLAIELAPLRFNTVAPGFSETPMWDFLSEEDRNGFAENFRSKTPTKRLVSPDDVAAAVLALMANPGINGQAVYIDGGYTAA